MLNVQGSSNAVEKSCGCLLVISAANYKVRRVRATAVTIATDDADNLTPPILHKVVYLCVINHHIRGCPTCPLLFEIFFLAIIRQHLSFLNRAAQLDDFKSENFFRVSPVRRFEKLIVIFI